MIEELVCNRFDKGTSIFNGIISIALHAEAFYSPVTRISQWISSYKSSSTLLSMELDPAELINCWCLCNWPWSLVTLSSNKLTGNIKYVYWVFFPHNEDAMNENSKGDVVRYKWLELYLIRRGIQCSAAILPNMPMLASWSENCSLSSSCSSLISSSSLEATPLAVWIGKRMQACHIVKTDFLEFVNILNKID